MQSSFIFTVNNGLHISVTVLCQASRGNDLMTPSQLTRHQSRAHPEFKSNILIFQA